jgi:hypothetical protein
MPIAFARIGLAVFALGLLAACASVGPGPRPEPYDAIDNGVPALDTAQAITALNALRQTAGAGPLVESATLERTATDLASAYALAGPPGSRPAGVLRMRYVAGKVTFEEALAAWRAEPNGDASLVDRKATSVGIAAAVFDGTGAYWVLLLG